MSATLGIHHIQLLRRIKRRCHASVAHIRQSGPDSGLGFRAKVIKTVEGVPTLLGSGYDGR